MQKSEQFTGKGLPHHRCQSDPTRPNFIPTLEISTPLSGHREVNCQPRGASLPDRKEIQARLMASSSQSSVCNLIEPVGGGELPKRERIISVAFILMLLTLWLFAFPAFAQTAKAFRLVDLATRYSAPDGGWGPQYYAWMQETLQTQANAVGKYWPQVTIYGFGDTSKAALAAWPVYFYDNCNAVGEASYHGLVGNIFNIAPETPYGNWITERTPYACITAQTYGDWWYMAGLAEHEISEATSDPTGLAATKPSPANELLEIVDPVEQHSTMLVNGVPTFDIVPYNLENPPFLDFLLPISAWKKNGGFEDYLKQMTAPE
jgi:hypothetical protein